MTQYHPPLPRLKNILMEKWHLIQNQPTLREIFKEPPILSYRRGKSLKDLLVIASHAVVFRGLVLPPPHKRLLTQAPNSFPIVLLPKHPGQSPSRHCLMMLNQIRPLLFPASFVQSLMRELSWHIHVFSLLEWLVMAETPKTIYRM